MRIDDTIRLQCFFERTALSSASLTSVHNTSFTGYDNADGGQILRFRKHCSLIVSSGESCNKDVQIKKPEVFQIEDYLTSPYFITGVIMTIASGFGIWFGRRGGKVLFSIVSFQSTLRGIIRFNFKPLFL